MDSIKVKLIIPCLRLIIPLSSEIFLHQIKFKMILIEIAKKVKYKMN